MFLPKKEQWAEEKAMHLLRTKKRAQEKHNTPEGTFLQDIINAQQESRGNRHSGPDHS
jgi:hypothetical protein